MPSETSKRHRQDTYEERDLPAIDDAIQYIAAGAIGAEGMPFRRGSQTDKQIACIGAGLGYEDRTDDDKQYQQEDAGCADQSQAVFAKAPPDQLTRGEGLSGVFSHIEIEDCRCGIGQSWFHSRLMRGSIRVYAISTMIVAKTTADEVSNSTPNTTGIIAAFGIFPEQPAHAWPGKDRLGYQGAAQQEWNIQPDDGNEWQDGIAQGMLEKHGARAHAFGMCRADIIHAQHLQDARAQVA